MPQEVLLYGQIWEYSAAEFINSINEVDSGEELSVRINSIGGDVAYGWGMIAKFNEFEGKKSVKVDGMAASMAAFYALYCEDVECLDVSEFMFHRAAFSSWYEENYMTESDKAQLKVINASLEKAFRNKIDVEKFENLKKNKDAGITVKSMFSMDSRIDVYLTPSEAKQIGLVNKIVTITPSKKAQIEATYQRIAAQYSGGNKNQTTNQNPSKMTKDDFKREHPEAYAAIVNEGVSIERERVGAWNVYATIDPEAVQAGIKSGEALTATKTQEFLLKSVQPQAVKAIEANGANPVQTEAPEGEKVLTEAQKIQAALESKVLTPKTV